MNTKKFVILHSNDMHGDFLAEVKGEEGRLIGGLALLSGYINRVRREEENVIYVIAGDMVQGSLIDAEFKGISTMEIMNFMAPDVVTLGNHEFDYGLPHLLFLEKVANFPIVNANLQIAKYGKRLMRPYHIINKAGFDIMFIGIITEQVVPSLLQGDSQIASFISLAEASDEVGKICNAYKDNDIDLTILLTHIGYESDLQLAALLKPEWGVDMMIGGHSHTVLQQPGQVNGILIAQAGVGTDQIGRFDIVVDDDTNKIVEWKWQLIPVDSALAEPDEDLLKFIDSFKGEVDRKYNTMLCRFARKLTHPRREQETELGNLFADIVQQRARTDVVFVGSGAIRGTELGPVVTLGNLRTIFPYDNVLQGFTITGAQLKRIFNHLMRPQNRRDGESNFYQVSQGIRAVYDESRQNLESLSLQGQPVEDDRRYTVAMDQYSSKSSELIYGLKSEELKALAQPQVIATSWRDVIEEHLRSHQNLSSKTEGRFVFRNGAQ